MLLHSQSIKEKVRAERFKRDMQDSLRRHQAAEDLNTAVDRTVDECIKEGILKEFLMENKAEVRTMALDAMLQPLQ